LASEGGQRGGGEGGAIRPGQLSALLQEIAAAPTPSDGGWGAALLPGARIGKFELVREIGRGGLGGAGPGAQPDRGLQGGAGRGERGAAGGAAAAGVVRLLCWWKRVDPDLPLLAEARALRARLAKAPAPAPAPKLPIE